MNVQTWAAVLTAAGVGGVAVEAMRAVLHRRGMDANAAKTVTEAAVGLVTPLRERVSELETDLDKTERHASELDSDLKAATRTVVHLTQQVVMLTQQVADLTEELVACRAELAAFRSEIGPPAAE